MRLLLDTGVLGQVCHPRKHENVRAWFRRVVVEHEVLLSEFADYELRRELLRIESIRSLRRLDELTRELRYLPVTTSTWRVGRPTGEGTDGDIIIAAQALEEAAAVVTLNEKHFAAIVNAYPWTSVPMS